MTIQRCLLSLHRQLIVLNLKRKATVLYQISIQKVICLETDHQVKIESLWDARCFQGIVERWLSVVGWLMECWFSAGEYHSTDIQYVMWLWLGHCWLNTLWVEKVYILMSITQHSWNTLVILDTVSPKNAWKICLINKALLMCRFEWIYPLSCPPLVKVIVYTSQTEIPYEGGIYLALHIMKANVSHTYYYHNPVIHHTLSGHTGLRITGHFRRASGRFISF